MLFLVDRGCDATISFYGGNNDYVTSISKLVKYRAENSWWNNFKDMSIMNFLVKSIQH